jgi:ClpX C4-type zinc finger
MIGDADLLARARAAGLQLAEAERQVLRSRGDYHTAIRRLHLAGGSFREIAQALALSHQRVQQIVDEAGGSWWRRVWRMRNGRREAVCTWCDRPSGEVAKLIAGPNVFICDACVEAAERVIDGTGRGRGSLKIAVKGTARLCAFCRKRGSAKRPLVVGPANVCSECLKACREILDARAD